MSIATEITRLQGIKSDIRTALVTQGIATASSHNMADFSADILAIQGGGEGVYITVKCNSAYQGYDIILSANESELYRKQCPSSKEVNFFVSADDVTLPATFTISNSLNGTSTSFEANMYGWYDTELNLELIPIIPIMTGYTASNGCVVSASSELQALNEAWRAFDGITSGNYNSNAWVAGTATNAWLQIKLPRNATVNKLKLMNDPYTSYSRIKNFALKGSTTGAFSGEEITLYSGIFENISTLEYKEFNINIPHSCNYFRLYVYDSYYGNPSVKEMQLLGYEA